MLHNKYTTINNNRKIIWTVLLLFGVLCGRAEDARQSFATNVGSKPNNSDPRQGTNYWRARNGDELLRELRRQPNTKVAKNIVFLMADGYSNIDTTVARIFKDQMYDKMPAGHNKLVYEDFDYNGELRTLSCDNWATDSAAAITAYTTGAKANVGTLNINCNAKWRSCAGGDAGTRLTIITELLKHAGKAVGVVTNTVITHASPAGFYAHSSERNWTSDADQTVEQRVCEKDIARQLVEDLPGRDIDVLLGGGAGDFLPVNTSTSLFPTAKGRRLDGRNLISEWLASHPTDRSKFISNRTSLSSIVPESVDFLLGLFSSDHLAYQLDRIPGPLAPQNITPEQIQAHDFVEPTLLEMTQKALSVLQAKSNRSGKGYFLYVEGGKIDLAHHENHFAKAIHETLEFERCVRWVSEHTSIEDTLIIVSSDHSHSSYFVGHAHQTEPILGASRALYEVENQPYTSLGYATGPGGNYSNSGPRPAFASLGTDPVFDKNYMQQATVFMNIASHGGQDVPVYASGPWAHLVNGQHDNTYLFDVMTFAACLPFDAMEEGVAHDAHKNNATEGDAQHNQAGDAKKSMQYVPATAQHCRIN